MTVTLASDTFTRANQSHWGTASDGSDTWSVPNGNIANFSIVSNEGQITGSTTLQSGILGAGTAADMEILVRFSPSAVADTVLVMMRETANNTQYRIKQVNTSFTISRVVAGAATNLTTTTFTTTAGSFYWIRARVVGSNVYAKIWADGGGEPGAWTLSTVDGSPIAGSGSYGLGAQLSVSTDTVKFDSFTVYQAYALTEQTEAKFFTRMVGVNTRARAQFSTRMALNTRARSKFYTAMVLKSLARSTFYTRITGLVGSSRAKFYTRMVGLKEQGRARFFTRTPLSSAARATFKTRSPLTLRGVAKFLILVTFKKPLKASFGVSTQNINATFAEAILARPYSTITVPATLTDANGTPITTASASVLVTFPDQSTQTIAASNQGAGVYQIQYNTKSQGLTRETWSFTGSDNSIAQYTNITPVSS